MLQQTTVRTVIPYYRNWLKIFPDLRTLANAPSQKVLKAWEGLGYYQRAKNLHRTAKILIERFGGQIPRDHKELQSLPGFGPYTTAAVLSLAYNEPLPVLDANVRRVVMRLGRIRGQAIPERDKLLKKRLLSLFPPLKAGLFNQAMMELGALVCRPRQPLCLLCPVDRFCLAYKVGEQEVIPAPKKRITRKVTAVVAVIRKNGKYLIRKRPSSGLLADLWEFPGGKKEAGETLGQALRREIKEEVGVEVDAIRTLITVKHAYTRFRVTLHAFSCRLKGKPPESGKSALRWTTLRGLRRYPFVSGSARIIDYLEKVNTVRPAYIPKKRLFMSAGHKAARV